jgi:hypothetical protein
MLERNSGTSADSLLRELYSDSYLHLKVDDDSVDPNPMEFGKVVTFSNDKVDSFYTNRTTYIDLSQVLARRDPDTLFKRVIRDIVGNYEMDQDETEAVLDIVKEKGLHTVSAVFVSNNPGIHRAQAIVVVPSELADAVGKIEAVQIGAYFTKISPDLKPLRRFRDVLANSRF